MRRNMRAINFVRDCESCGALIAYEKWASSSPKGVFTKYGKKSSKKANGKTNPIFLNKAKAAVEIVAFYVQTVRTFMRWSGASQPSRRQI